MNLNMTVGQATCRL